MPRIEFTPILQRHLASPRATVEGETVRAALEAVFTESPTLRSYILDDQDALRKHIQIFVDGVLIGDRSSLSDAVESGSEIIVMQALAGG